MKKETRQEQAARMQEVLLQLFKDAGYQHEELAKWIPSSEQEILRLKQDAQRWRIMATQKAASYADHETKLRNALRE
ncbi:hypothetical protein SY83_08855 [Paenibacillus swuensis]|uniref:Uncharacterized protein n=1 Tax=Paenibacillus swuensis TaxID=1178515 RepID=A0A172TH73_9BACL|nr:hypothetical protein [Paenibacillus swuensis]ANE46370.1 hypothetical protein SY83_08855 [Paenibacillus swuensis]